MATKSTKSATPSTAVVTAIPAVNTAWRVLCKKSAQAETINVNALKVIAVVIKNQKGSATAVSASIQATGETAKIKALTFATVKCLPTWFELQAKHADFRALPLDKQITMANKAYNLLGKGNAEIIAEYPDLVKSLDNAQAEKTRKAKASAKAGKADTGKDVKKSADLTATLNAILLMVLALEEVPTDEHVAQFNEISAAFESKYVGVDA